MRSFAGMAQIIDLLTPTRSLFLFGGLGLAVVYVGVVIYRLFFHPLAAYPGDFFSKFSSWPMWTHAARGHKHLELYRLHQKYGKIIRFGPNDICINSPAAVLDIYGSRKANIVKSDYYHAIEIAESSPNAFSVRDRALHAVKRRQVSHIFSESSLRGAEPCVLEQIKKWIFLLGQGATMNTWSEGRNMNEWCDRLSLDILSDLAFGSSFRVLDCEENRYIVPLLADSTQGMYTISHFPLKFVRRLVFGSSLAPYLAPELSADHLRLLGFCQKTVAARRQDELTGKASKRQDFFKQVFQWEDPDTGARLSEKELVSIGQMLVIGGSDTTSTSIAASLFYLTRNRECLARVTTEIRDTLPTATSINWTNVHESKLPYLRACIDEALRIAPTVPAHLPREVLTGGATIDGVFYPAGTIVGTAAYVLHHDETHFPDPFTYRPERWIVDPKGTGVTQADVEAARAAFFPFSIGVRGCAGKNMAYMEMSLALAALLWRYDIRAKEGDTTGEGRDGSSQSGGTTTTKKKKSSVEWGRERKGEYQLYDFFVSKRDGPVVEFRLRQDLDKVES